VYLEWIISGLIDFFDGKSAQSILFTPVSPGKSSANIVIFIPHCPTGSRVGAETKNVLWLVLGDHSVAIKYTAE
jgi:hypothetical protein